MPVTSSAAAAHSRQRTELEKTPLWQKAGNWWDSLPKERRIKVMKAGEATDVLTLGDVGNLFHHFVHLNWEALPQYVAAGIVKVYQANQFLCE